MSDDATGTDLHARGNWAKLALMSSKCITILTGLRMSPMELVTVGHANISWENFRLLRLPMSVILNSPARMLSTIWRNSVYVPDNTCAPSCNLMAHNARYCKNMVFAGYRPNRIRCWLG